MKHVIIFILSLALSLGIARAELVDSAVTVSLVTCSPGQEAYSLYGHTALRVRGSKPLPYDVVFNYGVFDFNAPNFVGRFVLGKTDYMVVPCDFYVFLSEYAARGSYVVEQVLNLRPYEADTLARALWTNCQTENATYRYNFFINNCTTKARDMVEAHIDGSVVYPVHRPRYTYRQLVHNYTKDYPWSEVGNDLLLGADADTLLSVRAEMFLPINMMHYADSAMIRASRGGYRPLVKETCELVSVDPEAQRREREAQPSFPLTPHKLGWLLFALSLVVALWELYRRKLLWVADAVTLSVQGLMGIIVAIMVMFSTHPTVGSNWQVWVLNPLPLVFLWWVIKADRNMARHPYHVVAMSVLLVALCLPSLVPQTFSALYMPLTLVFLTRSLIHLILTCHVNTCNHKS